MPNPILRNQAAMNHNRQAGTNPIHNFTRYALPTNPRPATTGNQATRGVRKPRRARPQKSRGKKVLAQGANDRLAMRGSRVDATDAGPGEGQNEEEQQENEAEGVEDDGDEDEASLLNADDRSSHSEETFDELFDQGDIVCPDCWETRPHAPTCASFDQWEEALSEGAASSSAPNDADGVVDDSAAQTQLPTDDAESEEESTSAGESANIASGTTEAKADGAASPVTISIEDINWPSDYSKNMSPDQVEQQKKCLRAYAQELEDDLPAYNNREWIRDAEESRARAKYGMIVLVV